MAGVWRPRQRLCLSVSIWAAPALLLLLLSQVVRHRMQEVRQRRDVMASTEIPAEYIDPAAIDLTPLVNTLINSSQTGSRQLFSLLSVTSHSSLSLHKLTLLVYNISSIKSIESSMFRRKYCYCVTNDTNDLTDFTAILLDEMGNSTTYLHELFKSSSILSVSQRNNSGCIYICVMAGRMGKELPQLWEAGSITPLFNQTIMESPHRGNISSDKVPLGWPQDGGLSHMSPSGTSGVLTSRVLPAAHVSSTNVAGTTATTPTTTAAQTPATSRPPTTPEPSSGTTTRHTPATTAHTHTQPDHVSTRAKPRTSAALQPITATRQPVPTTVPATTAGSPTTATVQSAASTPATTPATTGTTPTTTASVTPTTFTPTHQAMLRPTTSQTTTATSRPTTATPRPTVATPRPTTSQTTAATPGPTTATPRPTTAMPRPTTATPRPTAATPGPTTATPRPTTAMPRPTTSQTTAATPRPTAATTRPATSQTTTATPRPTTATPRPTTATPRPTTAMHRPSTTAAHPAVIPLAHLTLQPHLAAWTTGPSSTTTTTTESPLTEKAGCPWRRPELSDNSISSSSTTTVSAHKLQPCVLELCKFYSQCLCRPYSHRTRMKRYCDDSHLWYEKHTSEVCRRVRRLSFSRSKLD